MSFQSDLQDLIDTIRTGLPERLQETFEDTADRAVRTGRSGRRKAARHMLRHSPLLRDEWNRQQQQEGTRTLFMFVVGLIGGAALMYLFDPDRGARRRALLRDQVTKVVSEAEDAVESKMKDVSSRVEEVVNEVRNAADDTLEDKVKDAADRVDEVVDDVRDAAKEVKSDVSKAARKVGGTNGTSVQ